MKIEITEHKGCKIAILLADEVVITQTQDALDIMADSNYQGSYKIIMHEKNFNADFFDLKTGIAGEILQKFSTYNCQLAIIGDFSKYTSKSLSDFIFESNKYGRILFVDSIDEAKEKLCRK